MTDDAGADDGSPSGGSNGTDDADDANDANDASAERASGEARAIERVDEPVTVDSLVADLRDLGVAPGDCLLAHASLSALGWVAGGAQAVADALRAAVTGDGTLVVPTHSAQCTDPGNWSTPPVPEAWHEAVRASTPAYHPDRTPTRDVGAVPECLRGYADVRRSPHPSVSFAAWGADAAVVDDHPLDHPLGNDSPLAAVEALDGDVLTLGTGYGTNTSLHLAEARSPHVGTRTEGAAVRADGGDDADGGDAGGDDRRWATYEVVDGDTDFEALGEAFERAVPGAVRTGEAGAATARLIDQPSLVAFGEAWLADRA